MVDAADSKSADSNIVRVRVSEEPPLFIYNLFSNFLKKDRSMSEHSFKDIPDNKSDLDISLLNSNLELSIEERLIQHQNALDLVWELDKARVELNEKSK